MAKLPRGPREDGSNFIDLLARFLLFFVGGAPVLIVSVDEGSWLFCCTSGNRLITPHSANSSCAASSTQTSKLTRRPTNTWGTHSANTEETREMDMSVSLLSVLLSEGHRQSQPLRDLMDSVPAMAG